MLPRPLMLLGAAAAVALQVQRAPEPPRAVAAAALRAVEGDSAPALRARWEERLRRDAGDRAAVLGLASLALLTYDYPLADRHTTALERGPDDGYTLQLLLARITTAHGRGEFQASVALLERARTLAATLGDRAGEAHALLLLSVARNALGDPRGGQATLDTVAPLLAEEELELRAFHHARRAYHFARFGGGPARPEVHACRALARQARAPRTESMCEFSAFLDHMRDGDLDSVFIALADEERLDRASRNLHSLSRTIAQRASIHISAHELGSAQGPLREALELATRSGRRTAYELTDLAIIAFMTRDYEQSRAYALQAVQRLDSLGLVEGAANARGTLAAIARATGDLPEARRLLAAQLAWADSAGYDGVVINSHLDLARVALAEGDLEAAERHVDAAEAAQRRQGAIRTGRDLRAAIAVRRGHWAEAERVLLDALSRTDSARYAMRFQFRTQLARVRAMQGQVDDALRELTQGAAEFDGWRATLDDASLRALAFDLHDDPDPDFGFGAALAVVAGAGHAERAFELAERRRARELSDRLVRAVAGTSDERAAPRATPTTSGALAAAALAAALPANTALLEYAAAPGAPTTLFVVTRAGVEAVALPSISALAARLDRFATLLESGTAPAALSRELGAALLEPAVRRLGPEVTQLVIVPDAALHRLAFDALTLADGRYVVERFAVSLAPSAAVAAELWRRSPTARPASHATTARATGPRATARLLALGDPEFAAGDDAQASERLRSAFAASGGLPRLAASGREARGVARFAAEADVRLRDGASEAFLKRAVGDSLHVLHLATHAMVDDQGTTRTAVALAPGEGEDGFLTPGELAALPLRADLVVLSACRTAGGRLVSGEGVQGLTAPLLAAGARAVVATQWRIGDRATVPFVEAFYAALARGLDVSAALRAAKLDAIARGAPPSEWAAFTVVGDGSVTVPLQAPAAPRGWWLAGAGGLALVAAALGLHRRARG